MKDKALDMALEFFETMKRYKRVRSNIFIRFEPTATGDYLDLREFDERAEPTITAIKQALAAPVQEPPPECQTEAEKRAYAFGWWKALEANRAAPVQEPVAWLVNGSMVVQEDWIERLHWPFAYVAVGRAIPNSWVPVLYTTPQPQRGWVGLTDEEIDDLAEFHGLDFMSYAPFTRDIEAKLKQKNGYAEENT